MDLSNPEEVILYLENTPFASETVKPLSGGTANYVYRIKLRTSYHGHSTLVLKHAKPYLSCSKDFAFAVERQLFEVVAITSVAAWIPHDSKVGVANIYRFDTDKHVIIMDDCGEDVVDLKTLMLRKPPNPALSSQIGAAVGEFLGCLHKWGKGREGILHFFEANTEARRISSLVTYGRLVSTITGQDALPKLSDPPLDITPEEIHKISEIAAERVSEIAISRETMTMGDFWTGNLLVDIDEAEGGLKKITVVDWEGAKPGPAALDIGQFYAEMDLLSQFHPSCKESGSSLCRSLLEKYAKTYPVDSTLIHKAAIHVGSHLITWTPRVEWGGKEDTQRVVRRGIKYILEADKMNELKEIMYLPL